MASNHIHHKITQRIERFFDFRGKSKKKPMEMASSDEVPVVSLEEAVDPLVSIVHNVKKMASSAKQKCRVPPADELTLDQSAAIQLYTMEWSPPEQCLYMVLNRTLREENDIDIKVWSLYLKLFTTALDRLPSTHQTVYRGIKETSSTKEYQEGDILVWKAFSSCTRTIHVVNHGRFMTTTNKRTIFAIDCFSGKSIQKHSAYPNESEILLPAGRQFQVIGHLKSGENLSIVQLKELDSSAPKGATAEPPSKTGVSDSICLETASWEQNGLTVLGGHGEGDGIDQMSRPQALGLDNENQKIYVADTLNHRILVGAIGENDVKILIGQHGSGIGLNQLNSPSDLVWDSIHQSLLICDRGNGRILRWPYTANGVSPDQSGEVLIRDIACQGIALDDQGFLYVSDYVRHEVKRYRIGDSKGVVVAGGNGEGDGLNQLNQPSYIFVDHQYSVYISDQMNDRVMKWEKGAKSGTVVAGLRGCGSRLDQLWVPRGLWVDRNGTVYVADSLNHRIVRWSKGREQGEVIVGRHGVGSKPHHLFGPQSVCFDHYGDLYVVDRGNARVQKYFLNNQ